MNLPNKLTLFRVLLIPIFVACFYLDNEFNLFIAATVFIVAYITDMLDGMIARKYNLVTDFGKLMDPMADKLLTAAALVFLLAFGKFAPIWGELFVFLTIAREFIVSSLRLVAASKGVVIAAGNLGKIKTILQFITLSVIMLDGYIFENNSIIKTVIDCSLIGITIIITVWSMIDYLIRNKAIVCN